MNSSKARWKKLTPQAIQAFEEYRNNYNLSGCMSDPLEEREKCARKSKLRFKEYIKLIGGSEGYKELCKLEKEACKEWCKNASSSFTELHKWWRYLDYLSFEDQEKAHERLLPSYIEEG